MYVLLSKVAGIDVHMDKLAVTMIIGDFDKEIKVEQFECLTFTEDLRRCAKQLLDNGIKHVAMESTGIYWKPIYNVFHAIGIIVTLGNATHMKNVPGRKTDMKDSEWIARLHRNGLIRPSYIPEEEFCELRQLTRHRSALVSDIGRIKNRVQKILEDGNIKLGVVLSDVFGVSGYAVVRAIADGVTDAEKLSQLVTTNIKRKEDIKAALTNCLKERHCFLISELVLQYMYLSELLNRVNGRIDKKMQGYSKEIEKLTEVPGISKTTAENIIAEATTKMEVFADDRKFAAWAGVASGNNETGGKKKRAKTRKGNPALKKILIQAATGAVKKKNSYYRAKYNTLTFRLGSKNKAKVAIANRLARAVYHIIKHPSIRYKDLGEVRVDTVEQQIKRSITKLKNLGVKVDYYQHKKFVDAKRDVLVTL